jgi:hypothetical protein
MTVQNRIPLPRLSAELIDRYGTSPGYRFLSDMARDGLLRTQVVKGRHFVLEADVPAIAKAIGLTPAHAQVEHAA